MGAEPLRGRADRPHRARGEAAESAGGLPAARDENPRLTRLATDQAVHLALMKDLGRENGSAIGGYLGFGRAATPTGGATCGWRRSAPRTIVMPGDPLAGRAEDHTARRD